MFSELSNQKCDANIHEAHTDPCSLSDHAVALILQNDIVCRFEPPATRPDALATYKERLENLNKTNNFGGLQDIETSKLLTRDLDDELKRTNRPGAREELVKLRVEAGLTLTSAYSNRFASPRAALERESAFKPEALRELNALMAVTPEVVQHYKFQELAHSLKANHNATFLNAFTKSGGKIEDIEIHTVRADVAQCEFRDGFQHKLKLAWELDDMLKKPNQYKMELEFARATVGLLLADEYLRKVPKNDQSNKYDQVRAAASEELTKAIQLNPQLIHSMHWPNFLRLSFPDMVSRARAVYSVEFKQAYNAAVDKK